MLCEALERTRNASMLTIGIRDEDNVC